nr:contact-dependent growth inhibition system immunity protein [Paraburkholderia susongensis]
MYELFGAYFNQDFDLWGNTIPEIVSCYKRDSPREYHHELVSEINSFMNEHPVDLDSAFAKNYDSGFYPKLWGHTTASFLDELKRLLGE